MCYRNQKVFEILFGCYSNKINIFPDRIELPSTVYQTVILNHWTMGTIKLYCKFNSTIIKPPERIKLPSTVYKTVALSLCYKGNDDYEIISALYIISMMGIGPILSIWKTEVIPLYYMDKYNFIIIFILNLVPPIGIEPIP